MAAKTFDPKKSYRAVLDTWLMGEPVRTGESKLSEAQVNQGLAAGSVEEFEPDDAGIPASPNGITEPIANQQHTAITQDSVRKIRGEVTGDANTSLEEAFNAKSKKK